MANTSRIKQFDGSNYRIWRIRVYTVLRAEGLAELVDEKPTDELKQKTFGSENLSWTQADALASQIVIDNLADSLLHYAIDATCYEIWQKLKMVYNRCSYLRQAYLRRKLSDLRYDGVGNLHQFFCDFGGIVAEIQSGGEICKMDDIEIVVTFLAALPSTYSSLIASFGEIDENAPVTLETVKGALLDLNRWDELAGRKCERDESHENASSSDTRANKSQSRGSEEHRDCRPDDGELRSKQKGDISAIRISNLPPTTMNEEIRELVERFGVITKLHVAKEKPSGRCKGFAYVHFKWKDDARVAIDELDGYVFSKGEIMHVLNADWSKRSNPD